jgi:pimeloyl-ACP methyl ester carboxylesterase
MPMTTLVREADGLTIRYAEAGEGDRVTVVLTSPWPESLLALRNVWERLTDRFHVIAIDLPGFGQSEGRTELFSPTAMGGFLVQLVREWGLGAVHLVGPDVGTSAALFAAATHPELIRSLVVGSGAAATPLQVGGRLQAIIAAPDLEEFRHVTVEDRLGPVYDAMPGGPLPVHVRADYLASYAGDRWVESARYVRAYPIDLPQLAEQLPAIETPVLIVSGTEDPLVPTANATFLRERLPRSQMKLLTTGHFAWEEAPDQYGDVLIAWLSAGYHDA